MLPNSDWLYEGMHRHLISKRCVRTKYLCSFLNVVDNEAGSNSLRCSDANERHVLRTFLLDVVKELRHSNLMMGTGWVVERASLGQATGEEENGNGRKWNKRAARLRHRVHRRCPGLR